MVSSRYSLIALDSNSDTESSTRSTGTFLCGEMARNQSGRLSGSMWRNSNGVFFSRSTIAERCTHGQVLKLTSRYFAMIVLATTFAYRSLGLGWIQLCKLGRYKAYAGAAPARLVIGTK